MKGELAVGESQLTLHGGGVLSCELGTFYSCVHKPTVTMSSETTFGTKTMCTKM